MCIVCEVNNGERKSLEGLKELSCWNCPLLTTIPNIKGLKTLECLNCPLLSTIPNIEGLEKLNCWSCPLLATIPNIKGLELLYIDNCPLLTPVPNIEGLKELICTNCPLLTSIPNIKGLKQLICYYCPWIPNDNKEYKSNINKLIKTQKIAKNFLLRKRLKQITPSILKIYYHPEMKGGYLHKKNMIEWLKEV